MSSRTRQLSTQEAELWARVARTVEPLRDAAHGLPQVGAGATRAREALAGKHSPPLQVAPVRNGNPRADGPEHATRRNRAVNSAHGLDAAWDRKLTRGVVAPDFTLDLHGCTLDHAHARLDHGLTLALSQGARLVLLVTGRHRPSDDHAGRSDRRGAIRAKVLDWLAAGSHASRIAAVRPAHPRHGGAGALYLVLRRPR